jgi:two-component system phosphate regulon sensor histidine kinase PhoR
VPPGSLSLRAKIVCGILVVGAGSLVTAVLSVQTPLKLLLEEHRVSEDAKTARLIADEIARSSKGLADATEVATRVGTFLQKRVTIVASDGIVLADTARSPELLENHLNREEIQQALAQGTGWFVRDSKSVGLPYLYVAARIERRGEVLGFARIATPLDQVDEAIARQRRAILVAALVAAMIALPAGAVAASLATRKLASMAEVADEIGHGELGRRIEGLADDEVGRIGQAVNLLADRLEDKLVRLTRDRALLVAVLDAVNEGLAFVDERGIVLASNGAFRKLAATGTLPDGQPLRNVLPEPVLEEAARQAITTSSTVTAQATVGSPSYEVRFRVLPTTLANLGSVALLISEDLSMSPRIESLRVESAALLTSALSHVNAQLPRETAFALELSRAAILLDEPAPPAEVVLLAELVPRIRAADEAPAVYLVKARAAVAIALLRLELSLREDDALPATLEIEPTRVALVLEPQRAPAGEWVQPRSSESLGQRLRMLARRLALAHLDAAGAQVEETRKRLVLGFPRA